MSNAAEILSKYGITLENLADPWWRLNNLYHILNEQGKIVPFRPNWAQSEFYPEIWYCNVILKSRQQGFTTFIDLFLLDMALFNKGQQCAIIADTKDNAEKIFDRIIRIAWEQLPEPLRETIGLRKERTLGYQFGNNSAITVSTSLRSGNYQALHVSEFGKICAKYPDKAKEIVTGSFNALAPGQLVFVESTAEGREGRFYEMATEAMKAHLEERKLSKIGFKFHFFAWWQKPTNRLSDDEVEHFVFYQPELDYFDELEHKYDIKLNKNQKAWYAERKRLMGEDMYQEHPSYPEEAFKQSIEGAYFKQQMLSAYREKRICEVPHDPHSLVHTAWDLGMDDLTTIIFFQLVGKEIHIIDYYEHNGEGFDHYKRVLDMKAEDLGYQYGRHIAPHDIKNRELGQPTGKMRAESAADLGIMFEYVDRVKDKIEGINACRSIFHRLWIDQSKGSILVIHLENYQKQWNKMLGCWSDTPKKNDARHGADALQTLALGADVVPTRFIRKKPIKPRKWGN